MSTTASQRENWSEHQTTMFSSLHEKQKAGKFCDVILKCHDSDETFNAHSCVLSSASPILDKLLQDSMDSDSTGSMGKLLVVLPEDIAGSCMESLINFIYSGNIDLSQTKPAVPEETTRRKSKRSSSSTFSKVKSTEDASTTNVTDDSTSIDISSLYAFLKASRCLEIHTLTEHLESAVTLSEMKMSELASASRPRRASASKSGNSEVSANILESPKNGKGKKKKQQTEKKVVDTKIKRARSPKKKPSKDEKPPTASSEASAMVQRFAAAVEAENSQEESPSHLQASVSEISQKPGKQSAAAEDNSTIEGASTKFACNSCHQTFKTRSSLKRHSCHQPADEQTHRVDSFPVANRSSKKLQCPTCQKIFTSPSVYELHMKKHISEIEAALAERVKLGVGKPAQSTIVTLSGEGQMGIKIQITTAEDQQESVQKSDKKEKPVLERPPKRASTKKFEEMMESAFSPDEWGLERTADSPKRKKRTNADSSQIKRPKTAASIKKTPKNSENQPAMEKPNIAQKSSSTPLSSQSLDPAIITQNEPSLIACSVSQEYVPLEKMDIAELVTVNSKQPEPEISELDESGSLESMESEKLPADHVEIFIGERIGDSGVEYGVGEIIPLEEAQSEGTVAESSSLDVSFTDEKAEPTVKEQRKKQKKEASGDGLEMCEICGIMVLNKKSHQKAHNAVTIECEVCGEGFKYRATLKRHMKYHTGEGQKCSVCKETVFSLQEMQQHQNKHNVKKMRTECPICKKSFTSQYVMNLHMRTHSGNEKYHCDICQRKFPYKSSLKTHMLLHTGERPYICSVCGKCFVQKIHAREHEMQHAGIRRFQCPLCDRSFAHKCGMTRHITDIHHKMRPFCCETCGKSFPRKTKLIEHNRMHTGEKPYVCDHCGMSYKANRSLKYHKKIRHNIIVKDYEVAIWRNGPLPDEFRVPPKHLKPPPRKKQKPNVSEFAFPVVSEPAATNESKPDSSNFAFAVTDEVNQIPMEQEQENIINNIATEVDVIATETVQTHSPCSPDPKDASPDEFNYQLQETSVQYQPAQYVTISETPTYQTTTLPPASTLTKIDSSNVLSAFSTVPGQKTFIVPLNSSSTGLPIIAEQSQVINASQMPGMMVTYMMPPPQTIERTELTPVNISESVTIPVSSLHMARSSSVPPMSTFRRNSNPTIPSVTNNTMVTPLPGMHTFTPVQLSATQLTHPLIGFSSVPPGVPVLVPATTVMSVAQGDHSAVQVQHTTEWPT